MLKPACLGALVGIAILCAQTPAQLVINEVHAFGTGSTPALPGDYLELWNQGSAPLDISGYSIGVWSGDTGPVTTVTIPCTQSGNHIIPGNCFWVFQEATAAGGGMTGILSGLVGMLGLPGVWASNSSIGVRITDRGGACVAYVYLRRSTLPQPPAPPNILSPCTWAQGNIAASGNGFAHLQRVSNVNTDSWLDWAQNANIEAGTPGAPNTTGAALQTPLGTCVPGTFQRPFETNSPGCSFDFNGATNDGTAPIDVTTDVCAPPPIANFASTAVGLPFDIAVGTVPGVPAPTTCVPTGTAFVTGAGQVVNVDFTDPTLFFLYGLQFAAPFPGPFSLVLPGGVPIPNLGGQMVALSATHPDGAELSALAQVHVLGGATLNLVHQDDSSVTQAVTTLCGGPASGVTFYGTSYSTIEIISNGRVMFGTSDTDFTSSIAEALMDEPFLGFWTDFNPALPGSGGISVSTLNNQVAVRWNGVYYYGTGTPVTFEVRFDVATGAWSLDLLTAIPANPAATGGGDAQFLGISAGQGFPATNAGVTVFSPGGVGTPAFASDMLYDYWDGFAVTAPGGIYKTAALQTGISSVVFLPSGGGYSWSAF